MKNPSKNRLRTFRPPLPLSVFLAIVFSTLSLLDVATDLFLKLPKCIGYMLYVCAAVFLSLAIWAIVLFLKRISPKQMFLETAGKNALTAKLTQSYAYRTMMFAYFSLFSSVLLTLSKMLAGWYYSSTWLMVLSGYYIVMCVSKFLLIRYDRKQAKLTHGKSVLIHQWKAYRICGIMLLVMTTFLQGVVIMIVKNGMGFSYNEIVVIAIAAYDFCCLANAIFYMAAQRKNHSPLVNAIKSISFASSLVAMLSLQTAMFASFGTTSDTATKQLMNILTGSAVCVLMIVLGIFMMIKANKELKQIQHNFYIQSKTEEQK